MTSNNLQNLHVVITRPSHQALDFATQIQQLQGIPFLFPTLGIEPLNKTFAPDTVTKLEQADAIIFISSNAVLHAVKFLPNLGNSKVIAIGPSTAEALRCKQIKVDLVSKEPFSSEALLALPYLQTISDKEITIITGVGGNPLLADTLKLRGAKVNKIAVYQRSCPRVTDQQISKITGLTDPIFIITSVEILKNLMTIMKQHAADNWLRNQMLLLVSDRIKQVALAHGFDNELLILSQNATKPAILEALIKWYAKRSSPS